VIVIPAVLEHVIGEHADGVEVFAGFGRSGVYVIRETGGHSDDQD
jgi:hypothetical protein